MTEEHLRIGVIGIGLYGLGQVTKLKEDGRVEITAISRRSPDLLKKAQDITRAQGYTDWKDLINKRSDRCGDRYHPESPPPRTYSRGAQKRPPCPRRKTDGAIVE